VAHRPGLGFARRELTAPGTGSERRPFSLKAHRRSCDGRSDPALKGKANEVAGKAKAEAGYSTGNGKTEAKGVGKALKGGKAQQATGKARSAAKKHTP